MKFEEKSFSSRPSSDSYRNGWEVMFGNKEKSLCSFLLTETIPFDLTKKHVIGHAATKRCVLPDGHDGNHQLEAV
jgi:hypothetical protein